MSKRGKEKLATNGHGADGAAADAPDQPIDGGVKKPHRWRNGTAARREVHKYLRNNTPQATKRLLPRAIAVDKLLAAAARCDDFFPVHELRVGKATKILAQEIQEQIVLKTVRNAIHVLPRKNKRLTKEAVRTSRKVSKETTKVR
jgi:hypothetical protein